MKGQAGGRKGAKAGGGGVGGRGGGAGGRRGGGGGGGGGGRGGGRRKSSDNIVCEQDARPFGRKYGGHCHSRVTNIAEDAHKATEEAAIHSMPWS